FAITRATLAQVVYDAPFGFVYKYQLPADCLRVLKTEDSGTEWKVEGRYLLTDESSISIQYIKKVTDVSQFDPMFCEALALRLAADLAYALTQNASVQKNMIELYNDHMRVTRNADAQEGYPDE